MKKLFLLLLLFISSNASDFIKNGELTVVRDKDYVIRCIDGYKWIQFIDNVYGKGGTYYVPSGNPQQMFQSHKQYESAVPIDCNLKENYEQD